LRERLGPGFDAELEHGRSLKLDAAAAEALAWTDEMSAVRLEGPDAKP
jgi:hypothetical protein